MVVMEKSIQNLSAICRFAAYDTNERSSVCHKLATRMILMSVVEHVAV